MPSAAATPRPLATFWLSGPLPVIERACLASMVAMGHAVTLYHLYPVTPRMDGVTFRDAREVLEIEGEMPAGEPLPAALISDIFRLRLMQRTDAVWTDSDMYFLQPLTDAAPHIFGHTPEMKVNNALLRLPGESRAVATILSQFDTDRRQTNPAATDRLSFGDFRAYMAAILNGTALRGDYGPRPLTKALKRSGERRFASAPEVFYPISFRQAQPMLKADQADALAAQVTGRTIAVHLWSSRLYRLAQRRRNHDLEGSYIARILAETGHDWREIIGKDLLPAVIPEGSAP